jgi:hypothetical protein
MNKNEVLIWIDPFEADQDKFYGCLVKGAGISIMSCIDKKDNFPVYHYS